MSGQTRRIAAVLQVCTTSDGPYQAVQLEDGSYALLRGGNALRQGDVLPFEPRNGMEIIGHYDKRRRSRKRLGGLHGRYRQQRPHATQGRRLRLIALSGATAPTTARRQATP